MADATQPMEDFSPITDYSDHFELYFLDHVLSGSPKINISTAAERYAPNAHFLPVSTTGIIIIRPVKLI